MLDKTPLVVGAGGFVGAATRYCLSTLVYRYLPASFPYATFLINVSGCFAIGILAALAERSAIGPAARLFWITGVLGGYTTFSTFGYETMTLMRDEHWGASAANAVGQVLLGLAAVFGGTAAARHL
jgi:CrcB protein